MGVIYIFPTHPHHPEHLLVSIPEAGLAFVILDTPFSTFLTFQHHFASRFSDLSDQYLHSSIGYR
jgi:hypothetical protein